jgi:hypothetical protein
MAVPGNHPGQYPFLFQAILSTRVKSHLARFLSPLYDLPALRGEKFFMGINMGMDTERRLNGQWQFVGNMEKNPLYYDMAKTYGVTNEVRFILWFSR